jgi:S-adenosylmethionine hydrolase
MPVLTLTTDWGINDHHVAAFKGRVLCGYPEMTIVDISNTIGTYDIIRASYVLKCSYPYFPKSTIHFVGVSRYDNIKRREIENMQRLAIRCNGHYFIGSDSGIFSLVLGSEPKEMIALSGISFENESDRYAEAICHIALGRPFAELGDSTNRYKELHMLAPAIDNSMIRFNVIYFDSFGNAVTNLTREQFEEGRKARRFTIRFPDNVSYLSTIQSHYTNVESGEMVAMFNNAGYLEIGQHCGNAEKMFGLKLMDTLRVEFEN